MLTKEGIFEKVRDILISEFEIEESKISMDSNLFEELELDSLDAIDLIVTLDKELDIKIDNDEAHNLLTVKDVVDFIEEITKQKS